MHYYLFNIADYRKDTQHLSPIEHYIYRELIDWYYLDEEPIPTETKAVLRRLRIGAENKDDLSSVLDDFFFLNDGAWQHRRVEEELAIYRSKADTARANGKKGGRPKKPRKTQPVNSGNPDVTQTKANQEPVTSNQEPVTSKDTTHTSSAKPDNPVPVQKIVDLFHEKLPELPECKKITPTRRGYIQQRWREGDLPEMPTWEKYFNYIRKSDFLMGRAEGRMDRPPFRADLEWITKPANYAKIFEGKYHGV